jgi:branched-chain amino acid transport system permease protein
MISRRAEAFWALAVLGCALLAPAFASDLYTLLVTDAAIWGLFAVSLNLLVGCSGLVSFGHAAYFGIGAYTTGILMKNAGVPFMLAFPAAGIMAAVLACLFGFFCVRLTKVYFSMLTLAFAQIAWAVCFKWNELTGGDQGLSGVPYPDMRLFDAIPGLASLSASSRFHVLALLIVAACLWALRRIVDSPFGLVLRTIRENPERAEFVGINVRRYELAAFVIAGFFAGLAGALFGIFNRGVFPDLMYWTKSAEVLIMALLGGTTVFYGPLAGAFILLWLSQEITALTEYWSLILGAILVVLIFALPGGIAGGFIRIGAKREKARPAAQAPAAADRAWERR